MTQTLDELSTCLSKQNRSELIGFINSVDINPVVRMLFSFQVSRMSDNTLNEVCSKGIQAIEIYKSGDKTELMNFCITNKIPPEFLPVIERSLNAG